MRPKFDPKEEFIVSYYRSGSSSGAGRSWIYDAVALLLATGLFVIGITQNGDLTWSLIGFGLLAYRLIFLTLGSRRYESTFTRIIDKYEAAIANAEADPNAPARNAGHNAPQAPDP